MLRRLLLVTGGALSIFFVVFGCYFLVSCLAVEHRDRTQTFAPTSALQLATEGAGTIRVVGDATDQVRVEFRWRESLQPATVRASIVDGRLLVRTRCPSVADLFCRVSATIHVPRGTTIAGGGDSTFQIVDVGGTVDLAVDDGSARIEGALGGVVWKGDNGSITVVDSPGPLDLRTDNGRISVERARSDTISATSDNGRIALDLAEPATTVVATADNGSITVLVPDDGKPYATNTSSDNGSIDDPIQTDPTAGRSIEARTDNGSISIRYRDGT